MMSDFHQRLAAATARIEFGNGERIAGADDKARAIGEEVQRRGRGGAKQLADELGVSEKTISEAVARARRLGDAGARSLPHDTLERLLEAERRTLPPLPASHWKALAWIVRGIFIDATWIGDPAGLLAGEAEDADLGDEALGAEVAAACRSLSRVQALAVIDACQRGDLAGLPASG
ncbi:Lrp/AsnC family transcriptional regulator [Streptomyces sp. NPDC049577]|uniref:Lrp/AsnC family transcriptional regulator n=1 Tax=Streptomyces sp. NPDC049577 TaxID=3155153 RepID=UPI0034393D57